MMVRLSLRKMRPFSSLLAGRDRLPALVNLGKPCRLFTYRVADEVFRALSRGEQEWLGKAAPTVTYRRDQVIYDPSTPREALFLIKEGEVRVYYISPDGRRLVLCHLGPGHLFGEMPLIGHWMGSAYAQASADATVCLLTKPVIQHLLTSRPAVAAALLQRGAKRQREAEALLEALAFQDVQARVASLLLRLADSRTTVEGLTHERLAEQVGASRETVTRSLLRLQREGLVQVERKRVHLLDREGLRRTAGTEG